MDYGYDKQREDDLLEQRLRVGKYRDEFPEACNIALKFLSEALNAAKGKRKKQIQKLYKAISKTISKDISKS